MEVKFLACVPVGGGGRCVLGEEKVLGREAMRSGKAQKHFARTNACLVLSRPGRLFLYHLVFSFYI